MIGALKKLLDKYGILILSLLYFLLRIPFLQNIREYFDSSEYVWRVGSGLNGIFFQGHLPLQSLFLMPALFLKNFMSIELALNLTSVIFGYFTILAIYWVIRFISNKLSAFTGAFLMIISGIIALSDLSGYSVSFPLCFLILTAGFSLQFVTTNKKIYLIGIFLSWFLALSGHIWILSYRLGTPILPLLLILSLPLLFNMTRAEKVILAFILIFQTGISFLHIAGYRFLNPFPVTEFVKAETGLLKADTNSIVIENDRYRTWVDYKTYRYFNNNNKDIIQITGFLSAEPQNNKITGWLTVNL
jgi:hypothetical protein